MTTTRLNQNQLNDYNFNSSLARQSIINGNFDVWQRGTSSTLADVTVNFTADRWQEYIDKNGGTLPTLTRTREILTSGDIPNAFYYTRLTTNGAGTSLGNSSFHFIQEKIEHGTRFLCGNGKKVILSFWARSSIANKRLGICLTQHYGTGGSPSAMENITGNAITLTSSWTKYTYTFTTNTLAGKTFGTANDDYIQCLFFNMWGTTIGNTWVKPSVTAETYGGSGTIDIAQVQLCAGDVALPFMPKSFEEELRACQRYYETVDLTGDKFLIAVVYANGNNANALLTWKVTKRAVPTLTVSNNGAGRYVSTIGVNTSQTISTTKNTTVDSASLQTSATFNASSGWLDTFGTIGISAEL